MPKLPSGVHEPAEDDLELGRREDSGSVGSSRLDRAAEDFLRAAYAGDDPEQHFRDLGVLTRSRERTIHGRERPASAYPSVQRLWYGEGEKEEEA